MPEVCYPDGKFSVSFCGPALDNNEISVAALAQSLLALDALVHSAGTLLYGREAGVSMKVRGTPRTGSFIVDLLVEHQAELASAGAIVTVLMGVIGVAKWAFGKKIEKCGEAHNDVVNVRNEAGAVASVNVNVVNLYGRARTGIELSRFTQTLDLAGVESITVSGDGGTRETVTKSERGYFHREEGTILSDTEATMVLEIISPKFNGSPNGWQFSAGEGSHEFTARVEDEDFLKGVRDKTILIDNNTVITANLRIVQKKLKRMVEERSILEVIEVRSSTSE